MSSHRYARVTRLYGDEREGLMNKQTKQTPRHHSEPRIPTRIPNHYPCPHCKRVVQVGDRFCGWCTKPVLVECSSCGSFAKGEQVACPRCGADLHLDGLTFAQNQRLKKLERQQKSASESHVAVTQHLDDLAASFHQAIIRLVIIALITLLALAGVAYLVNLFESADIWGKLWMLAAAVVCQGVIWGLGRVFLRLFRWESPWSLVQIRQEIALEEETRASLEDELEEVAEEIAELEGLAEKPFFDEDLFFEEASDEVILQRGRVFIPAALVPRVLAKVQAEAKKNLSEGPDPVTPSVSVPADEPSVSAAEPPVKDSKETEVVSEA